MCLPTPPSWLEVKILTFKVNLNWLLIIKATSVYFVLLCIFKFIKFKGKMKVIHVQVDKYDVRNTMDKLQKKLIVTAGKELL